MIRKAALFITASCSFLLSGCGQWQPGGNTPSVIMPKLIQDVGEGQVEQKPLAPLNKDAANQSFDPDTLKPTDIAGVWQAKVGNMRCQISTPRTKFGKGFRASTMLCPVSFAHIKYWKITDGKLFFFDTRDNIIASLNPEKDGTLVGKSADHEPVILWRE